MDGQKLFNRSYILLSLSGLIISFGYSMIAALISPYGVSLGAGLTAAGALAGIYSIAALTIRPFGGFITDVFDKRIICIVSTAMICVAMLGYSFATDIASMFVVRALHGIAFGINGTVNIAILYDYVPKQRLAEGIGYYSLGQVVSQVCGPGFGISLKDRFGYQKLFFGIAIMTMLAVCLLFMTEKRDMPMRRKDVHLSVGKLISVPCIVYALIGGLFSLENGIINSFLLLLANERKIEGISLFFTFNAIVLFVIRMSVGKIIDRHSLSLIVNISLITSVAAMAAVGAGQCLWVMLAAAILKAVGQGSGQISLQSACMKKVDALSVGIATSTFYIGADLGQGIGPIICGEISGRFGYKAMFYFVALMIFVAMLGFNLYQRNDQKSGEGAGAQQIGKEGDSGVSDIKRRI